MPNAESQRPNEKISWGNEFLILERDAEKGLGQAVGENKARDVSNGVAIVFPHEGAIDFGEGNPAMVVMLGVESQRLLARDDGAEGDAVPKRVGGGDIKDTDLVEAI